MVDNVSRDQFVHPLHIVVYHLTQLIHSIMENFSLIILLHVWDNHVI